jgi:hypothetical protein
MSQFKFLAEVNGKITDVLLGYDERLHRFFLVVMYMNDADYDADVEGSEYLYTNLSDKELAANPQWAHNFFYFKKKLSELKISLTWEAEQFIRREQIQYVEVKG